jgi:hypothetical protein
MAVRPLHVCAICTEPIWPGEAWEFADDGDAPCHSECLDWEFDYETGNGY